MARQIHELSRRRKGPFVAVNCAAIVADVVGSAFAKGELLVMVPRADREWNPHTSYHLDGTAYEEL